MTDLSRVRAGIDIVSVGRIEDMLTRWGERFLKRIYTDGEIAYCMNRAFPARSLAARFAAKEAFIKAVSPWPADGIDPRSIEVVVDSSGIPAIEPHGNARKALRGQMASVSVSHEQEFAVAMVVTSGPSQEVKP
ncbi:MAG: holo-ACP synthase [Candidatus Eisenbacteria bacterium]